AGVGEDRASDLACLRVGGKCRKRLAGVDRERFLEQGITPRAVRVMFAGRCPAAVAGNVAQAAIPEQVADAEDDGRVETVDPPLGQRLVVFGDVAVPDVAGVGWRGIAG